ncbi:APC family permease [Aestuariivirga sp.]|uniref:APC family permease n=1 Tax=Aestuariivirga sp. TaxID=2650926 RepID=UPI003BAA1280
MKSDGIGVFGALSIGVGGIVGGGFFATFGITAAGAAGGTPIAFLLGGAIALVTAYSYIGLTLRYPGPGGTVSFITQAFGQGIMAASVNVLLILSYVAVMAVYAYALAGYTLPYVPEGLRPIASHVISSATLIGLGLINFAGSALMERSENVFNAGKLAVLGVFIVTGLLASGLDWERLAPAAWASPSAIVASGMIGFLAYEGFELIANASDKIANPQRTLPIAFLGCVLIAIVIYSLAFIVGIGHLPMEDLIAAKDFAISEAAGRFLGPVGFGLMALGAVLASASAINADFFGASRLPPRLVAIDELPSAFHRSIHGKSFGSLLVIGVLALLAVNFASIEALSSATSGGFLLVFAAVNIAALRLAPETGARRVIPAVAAFLCLAALAITIWQLLARSETTGQAYAIGTIVALALLVEVVFRILRGRATASPAK